MNGKTVSLAGFLLITGGFNLPVADSAGQLGFSGQVVESGCEVRTQATAHGGSENRTLKVSSALSVNVDTTANACRNGRVPFSLSYQALAADIAPRQATAQGLLIITYN